MGKVDKLCYVNCSQLLNILEVAADNDRLWKKCSSRYQLMELRKHPGRESERYNSALGLCNNSISNVWFFSSSSNFLEHPPPLDCFLWLASLKI